MTFSKVHDIPILKFHSSYENGIDVAKSIGASDTVYIYGIEPDSNIYEETDVNNEENVQRSFDIR